MRIHAKNGCYLGKLDYVDSNLIFFPKGNMTKYMLEETLRIVKKLNTEEKK